MFRSSRHLCSRSEKSKTPARRFKAAKVSENSKISSHSAAATSPEAQNARSSSSRVRKGERLFLMASTSSLRAPRRASSSSAAASPAFFSLVLGGLLMSFTSRTSAAASNTFPAASTSSANSARAARNPACFSPNTPDLIYGAHSFSSAAHFSFKRFAYRAAGSNASSASRAKCSPS